MTGNVEILETLTGDRMMDEAILKIQKLAPEYAKIRSKRINLESLKPVRRALLMVSAEKKGISSVSGQEKEAYSSSAYLELLKNIEELSIKELELEWSLKLNELIISARLVLRK